MSTNSFSRSPSIKRTKVSLSVLKLTGAFLSGKLYENDALSGRDLGVASFPDNIGDTLLYIASSILSRKRNIQTERVKKVEGGKEEEKEEERNRKEIFPFPNKQ